MRKECWIDLWKKDKRENRLKSVREKEKQMLVTNPINVNYLTNFTGEGFLTVTQEEVILITDSRYTEQGKKQTTGVTILDRASLNLKEFYSQFGELGFEEGYVTYEEYKKIPTALHETAQMIEKIRAVKEEEEISKLRLAAQLGDACFEDVVKKIKIGMTEREIALEMEMFMKRNGAQRLSFDTIVASGINSSMPHAIVSDRRLEYGDIITLDFGCEKDGYCSDMTRTIFMGEIKEEYRKIYDIVLEAQQNAIRLEKPGMTGKEVDALARDIIKKAGYDFGHSLGHGVGMEVHELPFVSPKFENKIERNMVHSIEPGIYLEGRFGVRIEDVVVVRENGVEVLSKSPKDYVVIG